MACGAQLPHLSCPLWCKRLPSAHIAHTHKSLSLAQKCWTLPGLWNHPWVCLMSLPAPAASPYQALSTCPSGLSLQNTFSRKHSHLYMELDPLPTPPTAILLCVIEWRGHDRGIWATPCQSFVASNSMPPGGWLLPVRFWVLGFICRAGAVGRAEGKKEERNAKNNRGFVFFTELLGGACTEV